MNTHDAGGGAARVAWDLFAAYRQRGHRSRLAVGHKRSDDPDVLVLPNRRLPQWWSHFWLGLSSSCSRSPKWRQIMLLLGGMARTLARPGRSLDYAVGVEHFRSRGTRRLLFLLDQPPDIVHGHNLHGYYFDLRALPWLSQRGPLVLTLHDAWLLGGHCAHSFGCEGWRTGCGRCPDLQIYPPIGRDATAYNWRRKRDIYGGSRLYLATPSRWLMRQAEESMLATAVVEGRVIPNGVNLTVFHPGDRVASRDALGIPREARVILFTADGIRENRWKDYRTLREAVAAVAARLPEKDILFLALGEHSSPERLGRAELRFVPYQRDPLAVAPFYRAADVYAHAARADTFPCTVLEALACGTPVVATAVGGIPEQVEDGRTGFLSPEGDAGAMAGGLMRLLSDADLRRRMGQAAAQFARGRFDLQRQVGAYLDWYYEILETRCAAWM